SSGCSRRSASRRLGSTTRRRSDRSLRSCAMAIRKPRYPKGAFSKRGQAIFESQIVPGLKGKKKSDFVAIDIETGAFELDADELTASDRLLARVPDAQIWMRRVGSKYARHYGGRRREAAS